MDPYDQIEDNNSGAGLVSLMICNDLEVETEAKVDIINEFRLNNGVKIEENLLIDKRVETNELKLKNNINNGYVSILSNPLNGITYIIELPSTPPLSNDFLYYDGSKFEWINFVAGTNTYIEIFDNEIEIGSSISNFDKIQDLDQDTRICVEETPDNDKIRFYTNNVRIGEMGVTGFEIGTTNKLVVRNNGSIKPSSLYDNDVENNSLYFNKYHLVFKDDLGCVKNLYKDNPLLNVYLNKTKWCFVDTNEKLWGSSAYSIKNNINYAPVIMSCLSKCSEIAPLSQFTIVQTPGNCNVNDDDDTSDDEDNDDYSYIQYRWNDCSEIEVRKTLNCQNNLYTVKPFFNSECVSENLLSLSGTGWVTLYNKYTGNVVINIENPDLENCPTGIWALSKRDMSINSAIFRISHCPGIAGTQLQVRWLPNSPIEFRKTTNNCNGNYKFRDTLMMTSNKTYNVQLSGTSWSIISSKIPKYRMVSLIAISSNISNSPSIIFAVSKNKAQNSPGQSQLVSSPTPDNKKIEFRWISNSKIEIRKNTSNYDGVYNVVIH